MVVVTREKGRSIQKMLRQLRISNCPQFILTIPPVLPIGTLWLVIIIRKIGTTNSPLNPVVLMKRLAKFLCILTALLCVNSGEAQEPPSQPADILPDQVTPDVEAANFAESELAKSTIALTNSLVQPAGYKIPGIGGANGYPTVALTGVFQLDGEYAHQNTNNVDTLGEIQDGLGFRRARLAAKGKVTENTSYIMEFDFAQAQARFVDVWMQFAKVPVVGNVRVGRFRQPFGMAELTSIRELPFLERSVGFALTPFRQTGIMFFNHTENERATWAVSGYRYPSDAFGDVYSDSGYGMATRTTFLPYYEDDNHLIHIGFDYSFNNPARGVVGYATQPELFVGQNPLGGAAGLEPTPINGIPPFVATGAIPTQNTNLFNIEAAGAFGQLRMQSEFRWAVIEQMDGSTATIPSAYVQARYLLTGETLPYNKAGAVFGRVVPHHNVNFAQGDWGAWELAGRWSYIDMNGTQGTGIGGILNDLTAGVNWYINGYTKLQFNYIHAFLKNPTMGRSNADFVAMRAQVDF